MKYWAPFIAWLIVIFSASTDTFSSRRTSRFIVPFLRWLKPDISDATVRTVLTVVRKGAHISEYAVLAALGCVDAVCIFNERSALNFLSAAQPDIWVKGGDYTIDNVNQDERRAVEKGGGRVVIVPIVRGKSTTSLLEKIAHL